MGMVPTSQKPGEGERMLAFAAQWLPYGGGDAEDIMVTFGMAPDRYFRRLMQLVTDSEQPTGLDAPTAAAILHMCRRRLELAARSSSRGVVGL